MSNCFCGSTKSYEKCCELFISGKQTAHSPEALMRSRYSAYAQSNTNYVASTMKGAAAKDFNETSTLEWIKKVKWLGLTVLKSSFAENNKHIGYVEFIAHYLFNNKEQNIHEVSEFHFENDRWYYIDGKPGNPTPLAQTNKVGRNDPCPCGSGKKYKKCCNLAEKSA